MLDPCGSVDYRWGEAPRAHPTVKQCETCNQKPATVHITELVEPPKTSPLGSGEFQQRHVCERCAQKLNLLHVPVAAKFELNVLELLQSAHRARGGNAGPTCPDCGMIHDPFLLIRDVDLPCWLFSS